MNLETPYNFDPYREQIFNLTREKFADAMKQGVLIDLEKLCLHSLQQLGLPPHCPLKKEVLHWLKNIYHLDFFRPYFQDTTLQEIIIHSPEIFQIQGKTREYRPFNELGDEDLQLAFEVLAQKNYQTWNYSRPYCSFQTELFGELYRVTLCHFSITPKKHSKAFFRALRSKPFPLESFGMTEKGIALFQKCLSEKKNLIVAGPTGSGKTGLIRGLIEEIPSHEHIIILEDTYELVTSKSHITSLIAGENSHKSLEQYCSYALRMRPDRLIVGEIRSSEIVPFLLASNTGHNGLIASLHANSAVDALTRLSVLFQIYAPQKGLTFEDILKLICHGIDLVVYCQSRKVTEVIQVLGSEGTVPYYQRWDFN